MYIRTLFCICAIPLQGLLAQFAEEFKEHDATLFVDEGSEPADHPQQNEPLIVYQAPPVSVSELTPLQINPVPAPESSAFTPSLLIVDRFFSPEMGSEGFIPLLRTVQGIEDRIFPSFRAPSSSWMARLRRVGEELLIWSPLNTLTATMQHEVFGHGYRVRSLGEARARVDSYRFGTPPPYGFGGGATYFFISSDWNVVSAQERIAITGAGVEATTILSRRLKMKWLQKGQINPREISLYNESAHDSTQYCWLTVAAQLHNEEMYGDMYEYVEELNQEYGSTLTIKSLAYQSLVNFIDPFTVYTIWGTLSYWWSGTSISIPMIPLGEYAYLPSARLGLSPFGPEYYLEHFLVKDNSPIYLYLRGGSCADNRYWGMGIEADSLWKWNHAEYGVRGDVWVQPVWQHTQNAWRLGASGSLIGVQPVTEQGSLYLQVGMKSAGYVPGEMLQAGWMGKAGLSINM